MLTQDDPAKVLIDKLLELHDAHDKRNDMNARGNLANLRYALRDRLHADYPVARVIPALVGGSLTEDDERNEWHTVIAALFGYAHDEVKNVKGVSFGTAARELYEIRKSDGKNDSMERRFMAMLNSDSEHLPGHLRQAISLLKSEKKKKIELGWKQLLEDVCTWDAYDKRVQKRWIRDYYRRRHDSDPPTTDTVEEKQPPEGEPLS